MHVNLLFRRTGHHSSGLYVELRSMPRTLYRAANQSSVAERAPAVSAAIS